MCMCFPHRLPDPLGHVGELLSNLIYNLQHDVQKNYSLSEVNCYTYAFRWDLLQPSIFKMIYTFVHSNYWSALGYMSRGSFQFGTYYPVAEEILSGIIYTIFRPVRCFLMLCSYSCKLDQYMARSYVCRGSAVAPRGKVTVPLNSNIVTENVEAPLSLTVSVYYMFLYK